jgi:lipoyl(octanoyl) transferase
MAAAELWVCNAGQIDYRSALELQERLRDARVQEIIPDVLLLLEHSPAVYTRGRRSAPGELSMGEAWYAERGIEIIDTRRGGKVTYHGPGQLVGYGIVRVDDVVGYVRLLERALVGALAEEGIVARGRYEDGPDYTGVWVEDRKIASIGVHVSRGVTTHGFAINVVNDLAPFGWVIACGLPDVEMTSVTAELSRSGSVGCKPSSAGSAEPGAASISCFRKRAAFVLARELGLRQRLVSLERLERHAASAAEATTAASII